MVVSWADLEAAAPEIAGAGGRLLADPDGSPGVAFLATVAADGTPRVHPFIPAIVARRLWAFVNESPKLRDLERNGRYAIHSALGPNDESFFVAGTAHRIDDETRRASVGAAMPYTDIDRHHVLYEFDVRRALWTTWTTPTEPVYRRWQSDATRAPRSR